MAYCCKLGFPFVLLTSTLIRVKQIRARKSEISLKTGKLAKLLDEKVSLHCAFDIKCDYLYTYFLIFISQGMYEEKDFLQLMMVGVKDVTEEFLSLSKLVNVSIQDNQIY